MKQIAEYTTEARRKRRRDVEITDSRHSMLNANLLFPRCLCALIRPFLLLSPCSLCLRGVLFTHLSMVVACLFVSVSFFSGYNTRHAAKQEDLAKHARSQVERGPVRVTAEVRPARPRLSDEPMLTLTIDAEEGVTVEKPLFGTSLGKFAICGLREPLPKTDNGRVIIQQIYALEPTETGRLRIDPIPVAFTDRRSKGDGREYTIETEPLSIEVTSIVGDKTPKLSDLRGPAAPIALASGVPGWLGIALLVVFVAAALVVWRKRCGRQEKAVDAVVLTPDELANIELDKLVASGLAATDVKQFYVALTSIVRRYIERTTGIRAPEQTTEEFLREIGKKQSFKQDVSMKLRYFLESADLVKFATHQPLSDDIDESVRRARLFIGAKKTTP